MIKSEFIFRGIGQGGFYTGKIKNQARDFNFVYDCGTLSEREVLLRNIADFKYDLSKDKLDVLFVSHLDDDHVNGIVELLNDIYCEFVFLPYLSPFQRLFVAIRHGRRETFNPELFLDFIRSPHDYLLKQRKDKVGKIIYIKGNSEGDFDNTPNNNDKPLIDNDPDLTSGLQPLDLNDDDVPEIKDIYKSGNNKIEFRKANATIEWRNIWEFFIYHEPASEDHVKELKSEIAKLYELEIDEKLTQADLAIILDDKLKLKKLREQFRFIFKSFNKTGLVVQHKPLTLNSSNVEIYKEVSFTRLKHYFNNFRFQFDRRIFYGYNNPFRNSTGVTLLTGDIELNQIEDSRYIKNNLKRVVVFQVPHHGSETGWEKEYLDNINHQGKTSAILNFGYGNKHGHPKSRVLKELIDANFDIRFCNQFECFQYYITVE